MIQGMEYKKNACPMITFTVCPTLVKAHCVASVRLLLNQPTVTNIPFQCAIHQIEYYKSRIKGHSVEFIKT